MHTHECQIWIPLQMTTITEARKLDRVWTKWHVPITFGGVTLNVIASNIPVTLRSGLVYSVAYMWTFKAKTCIQHIESDESKLTEVYKIGGNFWHQQLKNVSAVWLKVRVMMVERKLLCCKWMKSMMSCFCVDWKCCWFYCVNGGGLLHCYKGIYFLIWYSCVYNLMYCMKSQSFTQHGAYLQWKLFIIIVKLDCYFLNSEMLVSCTGQYIVRIVFNMVSIWSVVYRI